MGMAATLVRPLALIVYQTTLITAMVYTLSAVAVMVAEAAAAIV
jgi:hypothetical protein